MTEPHGPAIPRPLLDPFTEDTTRMFGEALDAARASGDYAEVMRVSNLLAAEAMVDPDLVLGMGLFRLSITARANGDEAEAAMLLLLIRELCPPETGRRVILGSYLNVGLRNGWLPAAEHDALTKAVAGTTGEPLVARIERRE